MTYLAKFSPTFFLGRAGPLLPFIRQPFWELADEKAIFLILLQNPTPIPSSRLAAATEKITEKGWIDGIAITAGYVCNLIPVVYVQSLH